MRHLRKIITIFMTALPGMATTADANGFELRMIDTRIRIFRDRDGDVQSIDIHTVDQSPLAIDVLLSTTIARSIGMDMKLLGPGHPHHPKRILALPSGGQLKGSIAAKHSDWGREIPFALYSLEHVSEHWVWPLKKGIPIMVEYENGEWGFLNITPSSRTERTKVEYYAFSSPVPGSLNDLLRSVYAEGRWPPPRLAAVQQLTEKEYRTHYLRQGKDELSKMHESMRVNLGFLKPYLRIKAIFSGQTNDQPKMREIFGEMWTLADLNSNKNYENNAYPHFATSHWAIISLLNHTSEKNLEFLMSSHEDEIRLAARLAPHAFAPHFFVNLFRVSQPVRPTRIFALDLLLSSKYFNHPKVAIAVARLREAVIYQFEFMPTIFFAELRRSPQLTDTTVQFLVDTYVHHVPSSVSADTNFLAWLMSLVAAGRDTPAMRDFINHFRNNGAKRIIFENALERGKVKRMFDCQLMIRMLDGA